MFQKLSDIVSYPSFLNPANFLTKQKTAPALDKLMQSNKIESKAKHELTVLLNS